MDCNIGCTAIPSHIGIRGNEKADMFARYVAIHGRYKYQSF